MKVHSSDLDPDELRHLLADRIAQDQARDFRWYFVKRLAGIAAVVWLLSWPVHLLPHTVVWSLLAAGAFAYGLMSPPRKHRSTRDTALKHWHSR